MASKKKKEQESSEVKESKWQSINSEIKKSIAAVLLIGAAIIFLLAAFHKAGPAGEIIYKSLSGILGWGYFILPFVALLTAGVFLFVESIKFMTPTFLGALFLILSLLGFVDIVFPQKAGLAGNIIGLIEVPFGSIAALVIIVSLAAASLLVTLNIPLKIKKRKSAEDKAQGERQEPEIKSFEENAISVENAPEEKDEKKQTPLKHVFSAKKERADKSRPLLKTALHNYLPPPLSLLISKTEKPAAGDLRTNANTIKRTLESFGIPVEMGEINIGPKVTRYTLKPAEGVKLSRITALNQDISLALAAHPLRIEAPIPGKSLVGVEVPNKSAAVVRLGSLISYSDFQKSGPLSLLIGRDVTGEPIGINIAKMPHLLISGATGSGKSILIHSIIISLLYKNSPETLRFVMIDPKRVELSVYNGIPHLIASVVTQGKKAINVFRWAIQEMENRYEKLLKAGARDIESYNANNKETMPYLVIIVDELADLMAAHGREIESAIVRLAQMARATGIHLILATQRPSVEVITGLIKANITARIALQVASQVDSRTILDIAGAEKLLGGGDMLFVSSEFSKPKRIQGAFVSELEIKKVVDYIKKHNKQITDTQQETQQEEINLDDFAKSSIESSSSVNFDEFQPEEEDELFEEAVDIVRQAQKASASFLQRRLKIGYARAARLLDMMEEKGYIGPGEGAKPREVYLKPLEPITPPDDNKKI